jgi:malate synthase
MGGMAAQIPIKDDPERNARALEKVRADKAREVRDGHDGTWVAHPGLVRVAEEVFDAHMPGPNQLHVRREDVEVGPRSLLRVPVGTRTEEGVRQNLRVGVQYVESWLRGLGCVPLYDLMEDAATAEISRAQVWQWIHHGAALDDGRVVTPELFRRVLDDELAALRAYRAGDPGRLSEAARLFEELSIAGTLADFLTLPAYELLISLTGPE